MNKIIIIFVLFAACCAQFQTAFGEEAATIQTEATQVSETATNTTENSFDTSIDETAEQNNEIKTPKIDDIKEMTPNANDKIKKEVVDSTNNHLFDVIKKFLFCMAGVIVSSIFLFAIGTLMNKFHLLDKYKKEEDKIEAEEIPNSDDEDEALKIFFDVTK